MQQAGRSLASLYAEGCFVCTDTVICVVHTTEHESAHDQKCGCFNGFSLGFSLGAFNIQSRYYEQRDGEDSEVALRL